VNPDFRELLRALSDADARFLIVGAYAVSYHAEPRATADLDIWIDGTPENAERVYRALRDFGAPLVDLSLVDLSTPGVVFQIGVAPRRIDILTSIDGVLFAEAWPGRAEALFEGVRFPVIGIDALVKNKRAVGRPKDLLDLELLGRYRRPLP
jgi:predicted nucleotidyltransferase